MNNRLAASTATVANLEGTGSSNSKTSRADVSSSSATKAKAGVEILDDEEGEVEELKDEDW